MIGPAVLMVSCVLVGLTIVTVSGAAIQAIRRKCQPKKSRRQWSMVIPD